MQQPTDTSPELFDAYGRVRDDHKPAELVGMSAERKVVWDELQAAIKGEHDKEQAVKDCFAEIKRASINVDSKLAALRKLKPELAFHDVWKSDIAKITEHAVPTEEEAAAIASAEQEHANAAELLQICQAELKLAEQAVRPARARVAAALQNYQAKYLPRLTPAQAHQEHLASLQRHKQDAKDNLQHVERTVASVLDAHLSGGRGTPGIRSSRQAQRNPINPGGQVYPSSMVGRVIAQQTDPRAPIDGRGGKRS